MNEISYILTLDSEQAKEALKAVELLMRLKINQPKEISRAVMPEDYINEDNKVDKAKFNDFIRRRDKADEYLLLAFKEIFADCGKVKKDREWYVLYNILQVIRYAIHEAEHPNTTGVDSAPPMQFTDAPLPKCEWKKNEIQV